MVDYFKQKTREYNRGLRKLKKLYNEGTIDWDTYQQRQGELHERTEGATGTREAAEKSIARSYKIANDNANWKKRQNEGKYGIGTEDITRNKAGLEAAKSATTTAVKHQFSDIIPSKNNNATNTTEPAGINGGVQTQNTTQQQGNNTQQQTNLSRFVAPVVNGIVSSSALGNGIDPTGMSTAKRAQGALHAQQAGAEQMNAQANQQIANRDYRQEADKNAAASAATQNAQTVNNMSASAGAGTAAMQRIVQSPDYNTMMNRSDTQRQQGVQNQREMYGAQQAAIDETGTASKWDYDARQRNIMNTLTGNLSTGGYGMGEQNRGATQPDADTIATVVTDPETGKVTAIRVEGVEGEFDNIDLQNAMNLHAGIPARRISSADSWSKTYNMNDIAYTNSGREDNAKRLAQYMLIHYGKYTGKPDDPAGTFIGDLRYKLTGSRNINTEEQGNKFTGSATPTDVQNTIRQ